MSEIFPLGIFICGFLVGILCMAVVIAGVEFIYMRIKRTDEKQTNG